MGKAKKIAVGCLGVFIVGGAVAWFSPFGDAARDLLGSGMLDNKPLNAKFEGDSVARLKAMHTAAMKYHESEEKFPEKATWMDDLLPRLQTSDLAPGEAEKKLVRPDLDGKAGSYGYALNEEVAGKYKGDLKDPKAVLIFESSITSKHAAGNPAKDGLKGGNAVTVSGEIIKL